MTGRRWLLLGLLLWHPLVDAAPPHWLRFGESGWSGPGSLWLRSEIAGGTQWNKKWRSSFLWENEDHYGQSAWETRGRLEYTPNPSNRFVLRLGGGAGAWVPQAQIGLGWDRTLGQGSLHLQASEIHYLSASLSELGVGQSWYWGNWRAYAKISAVLQRGRAGDYALWGSQVSVTRYFGLNSLTLFGGEGLSSTGSSVQPLSRSWSLALVWRQQWTASWGIISEIQLRHFTKLGLSWGSGFSLQYRF